MRLSRAIAAKPKPGERFQPIKISFFTLAGHAQLRRELSRAQLNPDSQFSQR